MRFYADLCVLMKSHFSSEERSDPNGIRTRVTAVKGRCPRPLDDRVGERQISGWRPHLQAAFLPTLPSNLRGETRFWVSRTSGSSPLHVPWRQRTRFRRVDTQAWLLVHIFSMNAAVRAAASRCG